MCFLKLNVQGLRVSTGKIFFVADQMMSSAPAPFYNFKLLKYVILRHEAHFDFTLMNGSAIGKTTCCRQYGVD